LTVDLLDFFKNIYGNKTMSELFSARIRLLMEIAYIDSLIHKKTLEKS